MNDLTLRQLEYLLAVAEQGSFASAAKQCHVSPVAIAHAIDDLEKQLGVTLFQRQRSRGARITDVGVSVVHQARSTLLAAGAIEHVALAAAEKMSTTLRIGSFPTVSPWALPPIIERFAHEHPDVDIVLTEGTFEELDGLLVDGKLDLTIDLLRHVPEGVAHELVGQLSLDFLCSAHHHLAGREQVSFSVLSGEDFVLLDIDPVNRLMAELLDSYGLGSRVRWRSESPGVVRNLVGRNLGVSLLVSPGLAMVSPEGRPLRRIPFAEGAPAQALVVRTPERLPRTPAQNLAIEVIYGLFAT